MKLIPLLMIIAGAVLLYSAKTDEDPRNVIFESLGIKRRVPHSKKTEDGRITGGGTFGKPAAAEPEPPASMPPGTVYV